MYFCQTDLRGSQTMLSPEANGAGYYPDTHKGRLVAHKPWLIKVVYITLKEF